MEEKEERRRRQGEIVKRSALRLETDLISLPSAKIPSIGIYYAQIVGEYCAKSDCFIISIPVESYNGILKACVGIRKTGSNGWFNRGDSVQFSKVFINFFARTDSFVSVIFILDKQSTESTLHLTSSEMTVRRKLLSRNTVQWRLIAGLGVIFSGYIRL